MALSVLLEKSPPPPTTHTHTTLEYLARSSTAGPIHTRTDEFQYEAETRVRFQIDEDC